MKLPAQILLFFSVFTFLVSCSKEKRLTEVSSPYSVGETVQKLTQTMKAKNLDVFQVINHDENALKAGMEIKPTKLIIFGNPQVGTKLMKEDRRVAIELPMKMLVYEKETGAVMIGFHPASTFISQYNLDNQLEMLGKIDQNIARLIQEALDSEIPEE